MNRINLSRFRRGMQYVAALVLVVAVAVALLAAAHILRIDIKGHLDGIFLLKGKEGWRYEVKDDIYVGDGHRLLWGIDLEPRREQLDSLLEKPRSLPFLYFKWDETDGSGFVRNYLADGTQLFTSFGRFADDDDRYVHGMFVGGGLPESIIGNDNTYMNNSGMAFHDGSRWYHIWCNANEGIISGTTTRNIPPSQWQFLGSRILDRSSKTLAITSSHLVEVDGVPLKMHRFVYMRAGETYFVLTIRITNTGTAPVSYYYAYGDEPWVGDYGSSAGDVGWVGDRIIEHETGIDTRKYSYAGMLDYGNSAIGEGHNFTGKANFIEWFGENRPGAYFSNGNSETFDGSGKTPLNSNTRFIGLQWGPQSILPGQTHLYVIALGMAGSDPVTGFPVKPLITLRNSSPTDVAPARR